MKAEDDPIVRFAAWLLLIFIAIVVDVLRTLFSPIAGGITLVLTVAVFAVEGLQNAAGTLGAIIVVIALYHVLIGLAAFGRYKSHRRYD